MNKTFDKPCTKKQWESGDLSEDGFICSKTSDDGVYKYRAVGNPGDIHYSDFNVVDSGAGEFFLKNYDGKWGRQFNMTKIENFRGEQIEDYEKKIQKLRESIYMIKGL